MKEETVTEKSAKVKSPRKQWNPMQGDPVIWIIVILLAVVSIVAVFSSSSYLAKTIYNSKIDCLFAQLKSVLIGLVALYLCYKVPLKWYRSLSFILFGISLMLVVLALFHGKTLNGAARGLEIKGRTFQVFEPAKVGIILYLARAAEVFRIDNFRDYCLKILLPIVLVCGLILMNSFSTALFIALLCIVILFVTGVKRWYLWVTIGAGVVVLGLLFGIYKSIGKSADGGSQTKVEKIFNRFGTAEGRIEDFVSGGGKETGKDGTARLTQEEMDDIRQSENAKIAISEGGLFGKGPGKSTTRYSLSMAFSDFIYAFIIEEYGLAGGIFVLLLYIWFFYRCIIIVKRCKTTFSSVVVAGIALLIVMQAMMHILVNVRLMPITGHTLPLISHGGTAYLVLCGAFGIILSVSRTLDSTETAKNDKK